MFLVLILKKYCQLVINYALTKGLIIYFNKSKIIIFLIKSFERVLPCPFFPGEPEVCAHYYNGTTQNA